MKKKKIFRFDELFCNSVSGRTCWLLATVFVFEVLWVDTIDGSRAMHTYTVRQLWAGEK